MHVSVEDVEADAVATRTLSALREWLGPSPPLEAMSEGQFLVALEAFEGASNQRGQLAEQLVRAAPASVEGTMRVLSVGCGGGDLDLTVVRALAQEGPVAYVGVDPNRVECDRCERLFAAELPTVEARAEAVAFSSFDPAERFDLVYFAHTLYYVDDHATAVERALRMLRPGGELVLVHAPLEALNRLAHPFWASRLGRPVPFVDRIVRALGDRPHQRFSVAAEIDATEALNTGGMSDEGRAIVNFVLQLDSARLPSWVQDAVIAYLQAIARRAGKRWLVPHPTDALRLTAPAL